MRTIILTQILNKNYFDVLLTVHLSIILSIVQLNAQILVLYYVYYIPLHVSNTVVFIIRRLHCIMQHLVSSNSVGGLSVRRLREENLTS